jgi:hypothetical protein
MGNLTCCGDYDEIQAPENNVLVAIKIPENVEIVDMEKGELDYSKKARGREYWGKIHTTLLRDLIENSKNSKNGKTNELHKASVEYLLKQIPAGINYQWSSSDNEINMRHLFGHFHKSRNPISRHIKLSNLGFNDYILLGAHETYTVNQLLNLHF